MSKKNGRRWFSKEDGTTFLQDLQDASEDLKQFFKGVPPKLKVWLSEAETIIDFLERLKEILESENVERAMEILFAQIDGEKDRRIFEAIKAALNKLLGVIEDAHLHLPEEHFDSISNALANVALDELIKSTNGRHEDNLIEYQEHEVATIVQIADFFKKEAA
jgi:hypothetical protein